jgi:hypothetical protein
MSSPQLTLDRLIAQHVTQYKHQEKTSQDTTFVDISVSSAEATLVLATPPIKELAVRENFAQPRYMLVNGYLGGIHSRVVVTHGSYGSSVGEVVASFQTTRFVVHPMISNLRRPISPPPFSFSIASLTYRTVGSDTSFIVVSTLLETDHSAPPNALVLVASVHHLQHRLEALLSRHVGLSREAHVVSRALELSENKHRVDPFSTIQPSFLIQTGLPNELRTDIIFHLLVHLRVCSLYFTDDQSASILDEKIHAPIDLRERITHRVENLTGDVDASDKQLTRFIDILLPGREKGEKPSHKRKSQALFVMTLHRVEAAIVHSPILKDRSRLLLTGMRSIIHDRDISLKVASSSALLQHRTKESIRKLGVSINGSGLQLFVLPQLLHFVQTAVWSAKHLPVSQRVYSSGTSGEPAQNIRESHCVISLFMETIEISASAPSLTLSLSITSFTESSLLSWTSSFQNANHSLSSNEIVLRASSSKGHPNTSQELAIIVLSVLKIGFATKDNKHDVETYLACNLDNAALTVPRSALRLYSFVEDWKEEFLPAIRTALQEISSEIRDPHSMKRDTATTKPLPHLHLHGRIGSSQVTLQVMRRTWLTWNVTETNCYVDSIPQDNRTSVQFGVYVASQKMGIFTDMDVTPERDTNPHLRLVVPPIILTGSHRDTSTRIQVSVDFFRATIKPSHWDTILTVQQKFGQDFNDVMALIEHRRKKDSNTPKSSSNDGNSLDLDIRLKMSGFCIGLRGLSSNLFLECENISGNVIYGSLLSSRLDLNNLALSLAPSGSRMKPKDHPEKNIKSAFVVIDLHLDGHKNSAPSKSGQISVSIKKIHAVMHPSSVGEIADFVDHVQVCST